MQLHVGWLTGTAPGFGKLMAPVRDYLLAPASVESLLWCPETFPQTPPLYPLSLDKLPPHQSPSCEVASFVVRLRTVSNSLPQYLECPIRPREEVMWPDCDPQSVGENMAVVQV